MGKMLDFLTTSNGRPKLVGARLAKVAALKNQRKIMSEATDEPAPLVMTIGHSTRTLAEFIGLLQAHGATRVVDVRTVP
jgi:hypothetical protein